MPKVISYLVVEAGFEAREPGPQTQTLNGYTQCLLSELIRAYSMHYAEKIDQELANYGPSNLAHCYLWMAGELNGFYILKWFKKKNSIS